MPEYRRAYAPGGSFFLTIVTYNRAPLFANPVSVAKLRDAMLTVKNERPFEITAAVILPDHLHLTWGLPPDDANLAARVGRFKILATRSIRGEDPPMQPISASRVRHRERDVWQRRFWEHQLRDELDFEQHMAYIHYNPVKHGLASCPHEWPFSSFGRWVRRGAYPADWCCGCGEVIPRPPAFDDIVATVGE